MQLETDKAPRRALLKVLGLGSVAAANLPSAWTRPVVESVVLPAHAQTSQESSEPTLPCETTLSLPGCSSECSGTGGEAILYTITIEDGCLNADAQVVSTEVDSVANPNQFLLRCLRTEVTPGNTTLQTRILSAADQPGSVNAACVVPVTDDFSNPRTVALTVDGEDLVVSADLLVPAGAAGELRAEIVNVTVGPAP